MKNKDIAIFQEVSISKIISAKKKQTAFLQTEIIEASIEEQLVVPTIQQKIQKIKKLFTDYVCADIPNAFWYRKQHTVKLPHQKDFDERNIPTKARSIQMSLSKT